MTKAERVRRVVGGSEILIEVRPFQVSIQLANKHICGGSVITDRIVLTAAHCSNMEPKRYTVRSGSTNHNKGGNVHRVKQFIKHPVADIALLEVCEPFEIDNVICAPIEMFRQNEESPVGTLAVISGWGKTTEDGFCIPDKLRSVSLLVVNRKLCASSYRTICEVMEGEMCAGLFFQGGKDACEKDSGGPLTIGGRLAGVVSRGFGCGRVKFPGIHTEVAYYRNWIDRQIEKLKYRNKVEKC